MKRVVSFPSHSSMAWVRAGPCRPARIACATNMNWRSCSLRLAAHSGQAGRVKREHEMRGCKGLPVATRDIQDDALDLVEPGIAKCAFLSVRAAPTALGRLARHSTAAEATKERFNKEVTFSTFYSIAPRAE